MDKTDKSLIKAHCRGDSAAFGEIVRRHGDGLLGYLTKMCGNRDLAEDFFQMTFKRVHEKANTFDGENLKPWIFTIATRLVIDSWRKRKIKFKSLNFGHGPDGQQGKLASIVSDNSPDPSKQAEKAEQIAQVRKAIQSLPEKQRATLVLAYYQQLSYSQVAEILGCSVGSVKTQMFRALKSLAGKLPDTSGGAI